MATEMSKHSNLIESITFNYALDNPKDNKSSFNMKKYLNDNKDSQKSKIQEQFMCFVVHSCDISHSSKKFNLHKKWSELLFNEFFNQGDLEKKLKLDISFLCDRDTSNLPKSTVDFNRSFVIPSFEIIFKLLPKSKIYLDNIKTNTEEWKKMLPVEDRPLEINSKNENSEIMSNEMSGNEDNEENEENEENEDDQ